MPVAREPHAAAEPTTAVTAAAFAQPGTPHEGRFSSWKRLRRPVPRHRTARSRGMGEVYRAEDLELSQPVALKLLPAPLTQNTLALRRLRNEVSLARRISHPNVCRVFDLAHVEDQYFLIMEYIDGEDLASVLRRMGRLYFPKIPSG